MRVIKECKNVLFSSTTTRETGKLQTWCSQATTRPYKKKFWRSGSYTFFFQPFRVGRQFTISQLAYLSSLFYLLISKFFNDDITKVIYLIEREIKRECIWNHLLKVHEVLHRNEPNFIACYWLCPAGPAWIWECSIILIINICYLTGHIWKNERQKIDVQ